MEIDKNFLAHYGVLGMHWGETPRAYIPHPREIKARNALEKAKLNKISAGKVWRKYSVGGIAYNSASKRYLNSYKKSKLDVVYATQDYKESKIYSQLKMQDKKTDRQKELEKKYIAEGMPKDEAELTAFKRIKTEQMLKIVLGVGVTAAVAYVAYKHWNTTFDKVIKKGTIIQNIAIDSNKGVADSFYAAINPIDKAKYAGFYPDELKGRIVDPIIDDAVKAREPLLQSLKKKYPTFMEAWDETNRRMPLPEREELLKNITVLDTKLQLVKDVKQVSEKNAKLILQDLVVKDPVFKENVRNLLKNSDYSIFYGKNSRAFDKGEITTSTYDFFNRLIPIRNEGSEVVYNKYFETLKSKGYDAIKDINDSKYTSYKTANPTIFLNNLNTKSIFNELSSVVDSKEARTHFKAIGYTVVYSEALAKYMGYQAYQVGTTVALVNAVKKVSNNKKIKEYRSNNPGSKLTGTEIVRKIRAEKER